MKYYVIENLCSMDEAKVCIVQYNGFPNDISNCIISRIADIIKENPILVIDSIVKKRKDLPTKRYNGLVHLFYFNKDNFNDLDKLIRLVCCLNDEWFERINILVDGDKEDFNKIQSQILLGLNIGDYKRLECINSGNSVIPIITVCYNNDEFLNSVCNDLLNVIDV